MIRTSTHATCVATLAAAIAAPASYACNDSPKQPEKYPDGATAALADMLEGQKAVKQFIGEMDEYLKCVDSENPPAPAGTQLTPEAKKAQDEREKARAQKHNEGVSAEETVRDRFNEQLKLFKAKQAAK